MDIGTVDLISQTDEDFYNPDTMLPSLQAEEVPKPLDVESYLTERCDCRQKGGTKCSGQCLG